MTTQNCNDSSNDNKNKSFTYFWKKGTSKTILAENLEAAKVLLNDIDNLPEIIKDSGFWKEGDSSVCFWNFHTQKWQEERGIKEFIFRDGSKLVLEFSTSEYAKLGKLEYIQLFFAIRVDENKFNIHQTEYFYRESIEFAIECYYKRSRDKFPFRATNDGVTLEAICKRKQENFKCNE